MKIKSNTAFTLVELLVVIAIIAILASLSISGVMTLRDRHKYAEARSQMQSLSLALSQYLADYGILGDDHPYQEPTKFREAPLEYLVVRPLKDDRSPYLSLMPKEVIGIDSEPVSLMNAVHLKNPWGHPVDIIVRNGASSGGGDYDHTVAVVIRSGPNVDLESDDTQVMKYDIDSDAWTWE